MRQRRVQAGTEPLDGSSLQALQMRREGLAQDLARLPRKEGCCGCGRACKG